MRTDLSISIVVLISAGLIGAASGAERAPGSSPEDRQSASAGAVSSSSTLPVSAADGRPRSDLDEDCDVDLDDYAQMQREFTGLAAAGCCVDNTDCAEEAFCEKPPGACDGFGECTLVGEGCSQQVDPVCGCDGRGYQNMCYAAVAGVNVQHRGWCDVGICELPPEVGPCDGAFVRWHFRPELGRCERFLYGGCGGNANNFETLESCDEMCRADVDCRVNQDCTADEYCATPVGTCGGIGRCLSRPQMCDPTHDPVCGCDGRSYHNRVFAAVAGVSVAQVGSCEQNPCALPIDSGLCLAYMPRFAFNRVTEQCERFIYGGCGGNANNFETLEECFRVCTPVIPCEENTDCPRGLFCQGQRDGVCEGEGTCAVRPVTCSEVYYPVCGCNGRTYASRCFAHAAGVVVDHHNACEPDVCSLPIELGPCDGVFERFAFNTETGQCEPFIYGGCGGNGNNFATLEHCFSECVPDRACRDTANCARHEFCAKEVGACGGEGSCHPRPIDCPRCWEPVCGCDQQTHANQCEAHRGGFSVSHAGPCEQDRCRLPIEIGPCDGAFPRYALNVGTGECELFIYGGCGGNANNFPTFEECNRTCGEVDICSLPREHGPCDAVIKRFGSDPISGECASFVYGGCEGNANNFETVEACEDACPPIDACDLPIFPGPCRAVIERFAFNVHSGQCERFIWGGCQANGNNFETLEACAQRCPPIDVCGLPIVVGPCEAAIPRYAFDLLTGRCELFFYGGCEGNANNFETAGACVQRCSPMGPCTLPIEPGPCRGVFERFAFNVDTGQCEPFNYGGCGGSANNFETLRDCQTACEKVCGLPADVGPCDSVVPRYYYNVQTNACEQFIWGGCGGNANNFTTIEECQRICEP